jgi:transposase
MTKTTYLGLDVHAATIAVAVLEEGQERPEIREIPNDPAVIRKTIKQIAKGRTLRCCYEAGPCGYVLQRQLTQMGLECQVIAPSLIPQKPGDRIKTDRRDAAKLARLLRSGDLTPITVPTEDQEAVRDLVRAREAEQKPVSGKPAEARRPRSRLRHGRSILENFLRQDLASEPAHSEPGSSRRFHCHAALLIEQPANPRVTNRRHVCFERGLRSSATSPPGARSEERRPAT